jgi:hypothetical protein
MIYRRFLRTPALLLAAFAVLLVLASPAAAVVSVGEESSPANMALEGEEDLLKATVSYDSTAGTAIFTITTREAPTPNPALAAGGALGTVPGGCSGPAIEAAEGKVTPELLLEAPYREPESAGDPQPHWQAFEQFNEAPSAANTGPLTKSVVGTTTTLSATTSQAANRPYNCAQVGVNETFGGLVDFVFVPLVAKPEPAPQVLKSAPSIPPALSIAKVKPLKLKVGKSKSARIKVTNTGGTATAQGSLRVKPVGGVVVKPEVQKLPELAPGASWNVSVRLKLTAKAKKKSTLSLTGTASGATAKGSLLVKLKR